MNPQNLGVDSTDGQKYGQGRILSPSFTAYKKLNDTVSVNLNWDFICQQYKPETYSLCYILNQISNATSKMFLNI